jgi:hypothetical protein
LGWFLMWKNMFSIVPTQKRNHCFKLNKCSFFRIWTWTWLPTPVLVLFLHWCMLFYEFYQLCYFDIHVRYLLFTMHVCILFIFVHPLCLFCNTHVFGNAMKLQTMSRRKRSEGENAGKVRTWGGGENALKKTCVHEGP